MNNRRRRLRAVFESEARGIAARARTLVVVIAAGIMVVLVATGRTAAAQPPVPEKPKKASNPWATPETNDTPLIRAARAGDAEQVRRLVAEGAQLDETNSIGWTPLIAAINAQKVDVVDLLLSLGAAARSGSGLRAVLRCRHVRIRCDDPCLCSRPVRIRARGCRCLRARDSEATSESPLELAVGGDEWAVRELIEAGADPSCGTDGGATIGSFSVRIAATGI
jgi:ankyrin repeat protein